MSPLAIATAVLSVAAFAAVLWLLRILSRMNGLTREVYGGIAAMFDSGLDDDAKEIAVRRAGFSVLRGAATITACFAVALGAAYVPVLVADVLGLVPSDASLGVLLRIDFILIVSVAAIAVSWLIARLRRSSAEQAAASGQSLNDKLTHTLAFSSPATLRLASRLDDRLAAGRAERIEAGPPIFITSLARGGTTALLNALSGAPELATHLYRDMPFLTAPVLWSRLGGKRSVARRERAHGDGLEIDLDTPEAFEEVLWMLHWPEKYRAGGIDLWRASDAKPEALEALQRHFRKIAYLRRGIDRVPEGPVRYLSKNNANIARIELLNEALPGAQIVVPLRGPAAHAASLMRQHANFLKQHEEDGFVLRYMRDIGHFEFGKLHRPLLFDGMTKATAETPPADYWLDYWIRAFREVEAHKGEVLIVAQDDLRSDPQRTMEALTEVLGVDYATDFTRFFHSKPDRQPEEMFSRPLFDEATELYRTLSERAVR